VSTSFRRSAALLVGSALAGQVLTVAAAPALSRIYSPADIGAFSVYTAAVAVLVTLVTLRFEAAIPIAGDDATAANLLAAALLAVASITALAGLALAFAGPAGLRATHAEALRPYLWLLPLGLAAIGLYTTLAAWAVRVLAFGRLAWTTVTQSCLQLALQIGVGLAVAGPLGLVLGSVGGNAGGGGNLLRLLRLRDRTAFRSVSWAGVRAAARRYRRFALISSPSSTLSSASVLAAPILLAAFYGAHVAGWYALSQRVVGLPAVTVGGAVANVFYGRASQLGREEPAQLRRLFGRMAGRLALLGLIPFAALALVAPWLFAHAFGPEWREAGRYARLLVPLFYIQFVVSPGAQTIFVYERNELQLLLVTARLALGLGLLVTAHALGWAPATAIGAYGAGLTAVGGLTFWLSRRAMAGPAASAAS
jgi:O-antigen/teichoic acid export membrane protein